MKFSLSLYFCLFILLGHAQTQDEKYHRVRVYYNSNQDLVNYQELGIPTDHGVRKRNVFFENDLSDSEIQILEENGIRYEVLMDDISSFYKLQNDINSIHYAGNSFSRNASCTNGNSDYQTPANFNVWPANSYGGYYTYSQLLQELDDMAALYPNLITAKADISNYTTEGTPNNGTTPSIGGNKIQWVKISDNPGTDEAEPEILYTSIHHAREPASLSQLLFFMWYLLENYDSDPEVQAIVNNTELYFIPVINPDGYLYNELTDPTGGGGWRKNRNNTHGTDNNRNYNYYINGNPANDTWGGPGSSSNPNSSIYHGTSPFSEVENQAVKWFVEQHDFVMALNNHTFGELIYFPFGYADVATPDEDLYLAFTSELVSQNGYTNLRDFPFSGDSDDFMYGTVGTHQKIFAMTPEIGTSFWPAQSSIEDICKDMMYTNLTAANMVNNYATIKNDSEVFIQSTTDIASYELKRLGVVEPANFTVSINPISDNIASVGMSNSHNNLNFNEVISSNISIDLDTGISSGELVEYELVINNGSFDKTVLVSRIYGLPDVLLNDAADNLSPNWSSGSWNTTTSDFVSASTSFTDSPSGNYSNNANSIITTLNPIDLSDALQAYLGFQAKWEIENNFDYAQVEVSTDGGSTWIPQCGNYTNDGVANQNGALNEPVYDGFQTNWVRESINLSDYIGNSILLRFKLISDVSVREDGFYFDDLSVKTLSENLNVEEFQIKPFRIIPNPFNTTIKIRTTLQNYQLTLFDISGAKLLVRKFLNNDFDLDLSDLSDGIYLLQATSNKGSYTFKLVKK